MDTTRRLFLAAGSAGAVFGALSAAVAAERNVALFAAIEQHKAAVADYEADTGPHDVPEHLVDAMDDAMEIIADAPCDDAGFLVKLRYMLADHKRCWKDWWDTQEYPALMRALDEHLNH